MKQQHCSAVDTLRAQYMCNGSLANLVRHPSNYILKHKTKLPSYIMFTENSETSPIIFVWEGAVGKSEKSSQEENWSSMRTGVSYHVVR